MNILDFTKKRKAEKLSPISIKNVHSPAKRFKLKNNDNNNDKIENMFTSQSENIFTSPPLPVSYNSIFYKLLKCHTEYIISLL